MAPERNEREGDGEAADGEEDPLVGIAAGAVTTVTLAVAFGLMFLGVPWFWVAFPVGFGGGMPLAVALAKWYASEGSRGRGRARSDAARRSSGRSDDADGALAALRDRYARGEIDDAEFETRVERLLETESVDDAETFLGGEGAGRDRTADPRDRTTRERERAADDADEVERA